MDDVPIGVCIPEPQLVAEDVAKFRAHLKMSQEEFAREFDIPISTLRNWEQGRTKPIVSAGRMRLYESLFQRKQLEEPAEV